MSQNEIFKKLIDEYVSEHGCDDIKTGKEIKEMIKKNGLTIQETDFCYNRFNHDKSFDLNDGCRCLIWSKEDGTNKYRLVGTDFEYDGNVYAYAGTATQCVVGRWKNGKLEMFKDNGDYNYKWFAEKALELKYVGIKAEADKQRLEFIKNYGPDVLKTLNGKDLLLKMFKGPKSNNNKDYLINVLERKTQLFGSGNLANAHNAGLLFKDKDENKNWYEPSWAKRNGNGVTSISEKEAIYYAESIRDVLIQSVDYISTKEFKTLVDYKEAENKLKEIFKVVEPVFRYSYIWIRKYFQMVFPTVFPIFYNKEWANYIVDKLKIGETVTEFERLGSISLYCLKCDIDNVTFAHIIYKEIGSPDKKENNNVSYLTEIVEALKQLDGAASLSEIYTTIQERGLLPYINTNSTWRNTVRAIIQQHCSKTNSFVTGNEDLFYPVEGLGKGVWGLKNYDSENNTGNEIITSTKEKYTKSDFLNSVYMNEVQYDTLKNILLKKQNIILQGAPGVGKTFSAKRLAYSIIEEMNDDRVALVQFHQNYSYEDFVLGYKPEGNSFELKKGKFYEFCEKAKADSDNEYFFIIDEINRGNMSKIFGELLMLIEKDYRGDKNKIDLAYTNESGLGKGFSVPENLYIIGMMNTADRSLAMIDYALRRRFSFFDVEPGFETEQFKEYQKKLNNDTFDKVIEKICELNRKICEDKSLGEGFRIGHSYFCNYDISEHGEEITDTNIEERIRSAVTYDILPMLKEYWFDNKNEYDTWKRILNEACGNG